MRISELSLLKYGRFDGCDLQFPSQMTDLQIIFGPNEAGKSTTMSAISDLLFGFPHITTFDFRHDKQLLRVGAVIQSDGEPFSFRRKKGRTGTVLDGEERALDERRLTALLAGYTADSFQRMFSLDHERLRQGGEAILQAQDDIGQAIFAAGSGLIGVARLIDTLEAEAKAAWTKRAGNTSYHLAQKAFEDAKGRLKAAQLKPAAWDEMRLKLAGLDEKLIELRARRSGLDSERVKIERHRRVLPPAGLYWQARKELDELGDVVALPIDAATIQQEALAALSIARTQRELATEQAADLRVAIEKLVVSPALLDRSTEIDTLRESKGAVDQALLQLPRRHAELTTRNAHLQELQREIGWPQEPAALAKDRLPQRVGLANARSLLEERNGLDQLLASAEKDYADRKDELDDIERQLAALPPPRDLTSLGETLRYARSRGDLDAAVANAKSEADRKTEALGFSHAQLAPFSRDVAALRSLALPGEHEVAGATTGLSSAEDALAQARRDLRSAQNRLAEVALQRDQLVRDERAVSLDAVLGARAERDATWGQLRTHVVDGAPMLDAESTADLFQVQSDSADEVADLRFSMAEQSGRLAATEEELARVALAISQQESQVVVAQAGVDQVTASWLDALAPSGLELMPPAFATWVGKRNRVIEAATAATDATAALDAANVLRAEIRSMILTALKTAGATGTVELIDYGLLLQSAESFHDAERMVSARRSELQTQRTAATAAVVRAETKLNDARRGLSVWDVKWISGLRAVGLDSSVAVAVIRARLDLIEETRGEIDEILRLQHRVTTMHEDVDDFDRQVRTLATECGVTNLEVAAADLLIELARNAAEATSLADRMVGLEQQVATAEGQLKRANEAVEIANAGLRPLMDAARVGDNAALSLVIARSDRARSLRGELDRLAHEIVKAGGGPLLDALLDEVRAANGDLLTAQSSELQDSIRILSGEIEGKTAEGATVQAEFARFDDGPDAAIAAADMEQAKAEMAAHAETYVRKRAAVNVLRWAIDQYRSEKQNPLLKRASALFSILTRGNYVRLLVDADGNKARLSGLDRAGAVVPVEGMSEGTVDQLFLALRLAAVEDAVASGAKLPFLVDDLFINYDDERAHVGFQVLAELAKSTQVLFFTHHRHLLNVAENAIGASNFAVCELA